MPIGITYYLRLTQRQKKKLHQKISALATSVNVSNYSFMLVIAAFLKTNVASRERNSALATASYYMIGKTLLGQNSEISALATKLVLFYYIILYYLSKFPLFGYKYFDQFI